jgi:hypothetical protein
MGLKLFKNTEEKMREQMISYESPIGGPLKSALESINPDQFVMVQYDIKKMNICPPAELMFLKETLRGFKDIGVFLFMEPAVFFINRPLIAAIKDQVIQMSNSESSSMGWVALIKLAWISGIPVAAVYRYLEGFEIKIFIKDQKERKKFIQKPLLSAADEL